LQQEQSDCNSYMYNKMCNRLRYRKEEFPEIDKHVPNVIKTSSKKQICNGNRRE
jgi:hypothetical protein